MCSHTTQTLIIPSRFVSLVTTHMPQGKNYERIKRCVQEENGLSGLAR